MLGFGKKKKDAADAAKADDAKKDAAAPAPIPPGKNPPEALEGVKETPPEKKKLLTKKRIFVLLLILGAIGISSFLVYTLYFTEKGPGNTVYQKQELPHVKLPEEMLKFCFNHLPNLYISLVNFNNEITLFDGEVARIETIAQRYPEQKKITDIEKKALEKGKNTLLKAFSKLEKPIKDIYVLFKIDKTRGLAQIEEKGQELTDNAQAALKTAQAQTQTIKDRTPQAPKGIFQGTLHKLKKKFL